MNTLLLGLKPQVYKSVIIFPAVEREAHRAAVTPLCPLLHLHFTAMYGGLLAQNKCFHREKTQTAFCNSLNCRVDVKTNTQLPTHYTTAEECLLPAHPRAKVPPCQSVWGLSGLIILDLITACAA